MTDNDATNRTPLDRILDTDEDEDEMPEDELDDPNTAGGGILSQGGTAVDRGTGTLEGTAQGADRDRDDATDLRPDFGADAADRALGNDD